jgi:hypothetical protein
MQTLGRSDRVDLPGLGLFNIHAKIDTGAYTSSLHCSRAEVKDGVLEFVLLNIRSLPAWCFSSRNLKPGSLKIPLGWASTGISLKPPLKFLMKKYPLNFR